MGKKDKSKPEVEPPKRAKRAIKKLHKLVDFLEFYCGNSEFFKKTVVKELASDIEEVLHELSIEKNIDHIRLATKLKTIWNRQLDTTIENRVEEEVEHRVSDLIEEIDKNGKEK
jgi:uncharacterized protein YaaR (DUF327 family)